MKADELTPTPDPNSPTRVYIPTNLQDCFQELDRMLPASVAKSVRLSTDADLLHQHFGLGVWMRINWGLWSEHSRFIQYFASLGIITLGLTCLTIHPRKAHKHHVCHSG